MNWSCNPYAEMLIERAEAKRAAEKAAAEKAAPVVVPPDPPSEFTAAALLKILNG
jgi:hypothetical protein